MTFRQFICRALCNHNLSPTPALLPDDVRRASHALNNATMILQGAASEIAKQADALSILANDMQGHRDERSDRA
jgi:hypothetical protein